MPTGSRDKAYRVTYRRDSAKRCFASFARGELLNIDRYRRGRAWITHSRGESRH